MIEEITTIRRFRITCDVCGYQTIVGIDPTGSPSGTSLAYDEIERDGWDVKGLFDKCQEHAETT